MYDNIGEKLKTLAKVIAVLGIIGSIISGIVLMCISEYLVVSGFITMISGSLVSWISSWGMYAIGDTNSKITEMNNRSLRNASQSSNYTGNTYLGNPAGAAGKPTHLFRCDKCGSMISDYPCENCNYEPEKSKPETVSENEVKCTKCGFVQPAGRKCCFHCGVSFDMSAINAKCPSCGADVLADETFCSQCGTKMDSKMIATVTGKCEMCNKDNTPLYKVKIVDDMGTRHRKVCNECLEKYNCQPE